MISASERLFYGDVITNPAIIQLHQTSLCMIEARETVVQSINWHVDVVLSRLHIVTTQSTFQLFKSHIIRIEALRAFISVSHKSQIIWNGMGKAVAIIHVKIYRIMFCVLLKFNHDEEYYYSPSSCCGEGDRVAKWLKQWLVDLKFWFDSLDV